jgi:C4-dicarboxylate transporter DctM subunit
MSLPVLLALFAFLSLMALGMPVFMTMGIAAALGTFMLQGSERLFENMALGAFNALNSYVLMAVPLYILAGTLLEATGLSHRLFTFAAVWVRGLRGGLGVATVIACSIFAAISGSSVATAATIGLVAIPVLAKNGYPAGPSGALVAAGGTLGILIPPSIGLLLYGVLTDQSVGALFVAGVIPGIVLAFLMAIYTSVSTPRDDSVSGASWAERWRATVEAGPILALPIIIFVGIYTGFATPTEVAAVAVLYIIVIGLAHRCLGVREFMIAGRRAITSSVMISMLVAFGSLLTGYFTQTGVPQAVTQLIAASGLGFFGSVTLMIVFYVILGMFLEALSMMLLTVPILYPLAMALGIHPLAFGIFVVLAVEVAQVTPPVGINLFTVSGIGKIPFDKLSRSIIPYVLIMIAMMYLVVYLPKLSVWLPSTMGYGT